MFRNENDPDLNLQSFNDHGIFTIDELNELFPVEKSQLSVLRLNIRSLNQHFTVFCNLLDSISFSFDFLGCSETWLSPQTNLDCFNIPGCVLENNRQGQSRTGSTRTASPGRINSDPTRIMKKKTLNLMTFKLLPIRKAKIPLKSVLN